MSCHVRSEKQGSWLFGDTRAGGVLKLPPTGSELESGFLDSPFETPPQSEDEKPEGPDSWMPTFASLGFLELGRLEEGRGQRGCVS